MGYKIRMRGYAIKIRYFRGSAGHGVALQAYTSGRHR